ncbi:unnamed protein product [Cuscuta epithymum]|uniref:Pentatricopeptide repeat-containing protein n=1 Tax=Cuscuta epithymum TaxID=186058 RepID=A0AAV0FFF0_9ASTE|nr:unnamed protein product [Cuscuta epithymum]
MPNFHSKKHLRYSNLNVLHTYCSVPFRDVPKPSPYPFQATSSSICDFDLDILSYKTYLGKSSSRTPSKSNVDLFAYPQIRSFSFSSDPYRLYNSQSALPQAACRFCCSSCINPSRFFSAQNLSETMVHNEKSESKAMVVSGSGESRRNANEISLVTQIVEIIRSGGEDFRSNLSSMSSSLDSKRILMNTFKVLNQLRISGLDFFRTLVEMKPNLYRSGDVCSLIINNCGWLGDQEALLSLLQEFKLQSICLNQMAFEFLPPSEQGKDDLMESTRRVIGMLNKVGGSCLHSGVNALIEKFCFLNSFQMAKFVMETTDRTVRRYNILIRARCKRGQIEEAHATIEEMLEHGHLPETNTFNYLIGYLCKRDRMDEACQLLNRMKEKGPPPDSITLEAIIYHSAIRGRLDVAFRYLDLTVNLNIVPRPTTLSAILNALFRAEQHEKAYEYVNDMTAKFKTSSNTLYNLFAKLHLKKGDPVIAKNILNEMVKKGLMPKSSTCLICEASEEQ